jgi:hypothetical protein
MRLTIPFVVIAAVFAMFTVAPAPLRADGGQTPASTKVEPALRQFNQSVADYMALRNRLRSEVAGPVKNSTSSQVNNASDALAAGIQRARQNAAAGAIFTPAISAVFKKRIADAIRDDNLTAVLADIDDEKALRLEPKVHLRLPVSAQMATMPASLLKVLPNLPKELEYRIVGRYLILRDVDASMILDYIPAAVTR